MKKNKVVEAPIPAKVNNFHNNKITRAIGGPPVEPQIKGDTNNFTTCVSTVIPPSHQMDSKPLEPVITDVVVNGKVANELVGAPAQEPVLIPPTDFTPVEKQRKVKKNGKLQN